MDPSDTTPPLAELLERRAFACRMVPDRALATLDEAEAFLAGRGMLTLTSDSELPSLFGACHEEPYRPGGHGFASWPRTKWWWGGALAARPGVHLLRIHHGKGLYLTAQTLALADRLCRAALSGASAGEYGAAAAELLAYLAAAGPSSLDDVKRELGLDPSTLRKLRNRLEAVGAVVSSAMAIPSSRGGGERESSELARWAQCYPTPPTPGADDDDALGALVCAGVRAAVVVPERDLAAWFTWPLPPRLADTLVERERLWRPQAGWIAMRGDAASA